MNDDVYIKERIDDQIKWYDDKATHCKKYHDHISIFSILCTSSSSLICVISLLFPCFSTQITLLSSVIAFSATILLALDKIKKYQELHTQYRSACEKLKQEKYLYLTNAGEYNSDKHDDNFKLFVDRCESIMSTEIGTWAQLNEKKQSN